jgi:hypothetical protein
LNSDPVSGIEAAPKMKTPKAQDTPRRTNKSKGIPRGRTKVANLTIDCTTGVSSLVVTTKMGERILTPINGWWWQEVSRYTWRAIKNQKDEYTYFSTQVRLSDGTTKPLGLHQLIYKLSVGGPIPPGMVVDHRDRNPKNNRASNLRALPQRLNSWNSDRVTKGSSRFPCVAWHPVLGKWRAITTINKKQKVLGNFDSPEEAAREVKSAVMAAMKETYPKLDWDALSVEFDFPKKSELE